MQEFIKRKAQLAAYLEVSAEVIVHVNGFHLAAVSQQHGPHRSACQVSVQLGGEDVDPPWGQGLQWEEGRVWEQPSVVLRLLPAKRYYTERSFSICLSTPGDETHCYFIYLKGLKTGVFKMSKTQPAVLKRVRNKTLQY